VTKKTLSIMIVLSVIASAILGLGVILASGGTPRVKMTFTTKELAQGDYRPIYEIYAEIARSKVPGFAGILQNSNGKAVVYLAIKPNKALPVLLSVDQSLPFLQPLNLSTDQKDSIRYVVKESLGQNVINHYTSFKNEKEPDFDVYRVKYDANELYEWSRIISANRLPGYQGVGLDYQKNQLWMIMSNLIDQKRAVEEIDQLAKDKGIPFDALNIKFLEPLRVFNSGGSGSGGSPPPPPPSVASSDFLRPLRAGQQVEVEQRGGACSSGVFVRDRESGSVAVVTALHCVPLETNRGLYQPSVASSSNLISQRVSSRSGKLVRAGSTANCRYSGSSGYYQGCVDFDIAVFPLPLDVQYMLGRIAKYDTSKRILIEEYEIYDFNKGFPMENLPASNNLVFIGRTSGKLEAISAGGSAVPIPEQLFGGFPLLPGAIDGTVNNIDVWCMITDSSARVQPGDSGGFVGELIGPGRYRFIGTIIGGDASGRVCWESSNNMSLLLADPI
jgi:hypothetical protein